MTWWRSHVWIMGQNARHMIALGDVQHKGRKKVFFSLVGTRKTSASLFSPENHIWHISYLPPFLDEIKYLRSNLWIQMASWCCSKRPHEEMNTAEREKQWTKAQSNHMGSTIEQRCSPLAWCSLEERNKLGQGISSEMISNTFSFTLSEIAKKEISIFENIRRTPRGRE